MKQNETSPKAGRPAAPPGVRPPVGPFHLGAWNLRRKLLLSFVGLALSLVVVMALFAYLAMTRGLEPTAYAHPRGTLANMAWLALLCAVIAATAGTLVALTLSKHLTRPVLSLIHTIQRISQGDDSARAPVLAGDELGRVALDFNRMLDKRLAPQQTVKDENQRLQDGIYSLLYVASDASSGDLTVRAPVTEGVLGNVADAVNLMLENVGNLVQEVNQRAAQVASSAQEIQSASEQLEEGARQQTSQIVDTTLAVQEMASEIESVSHNAEGAAEVAARAKSAAEHGGQAVAQVIEGMERIRQSVLAGAKKVKRLGERSKEISVIVNTISQISAQTDILALNAAIEAARAGDNGRGFTVVAEEVRKLAERAASATKEIEALVAGIQAETEESVSVMEHQTTEVDAESKIVSSAGSQLDQIREFSVRAAKLIMEINQAAKNQVQTAIGVVQAMQSVQRIAQQTQNATAQTKRSTESLTALSGELLEKLGNFKMEAASHPSPPRDVEAAA